MRYPPDQKQRTRERILDAAGRVFLQRGYSATGVEGVMREAGLTVGGFYSHFKSKEELLGAVVDKLSVKRESAREEAFAGERGRGWLVAIVEHYASLGHVRNPEMGCPLPALTPELGRAGEPVRYGLQAQLQRWAAGYADALALDNLPAVEAGPDTDPAQVRNSIALGAIAALVGAVTLARAMPDDDAAEAILAGARRVVIDSIRNAPAEFSQNDEAAAPGKDLS